MADKRNLDSCTIVDVSSQSEKGKGYTKRKIKTRERRRKEMIFKLDFRFTVVLIR